MAATCSTHPDAVALYRCDGCQRLLCEECFEQGHRLVFCRHCRERGIALDLSVPDEPARQKRAARERPYTFADALVYPFRGTGSRMFWSFLAGLLVLSVVSWVPYLGIVAGCTMFIWCLLTLWLLPPTMLAIIRTTERGDDELPDWPDFSEFSLRAREVLGFLLGLLMALIPGLILAQFVGCSTVQWADGTAGALCWLALAVHMMLTVVFWIPAFGAVGVFDEYFLAVRLDLHLRAVRAMGADFWQVAAVIVGLLIGGQIAAFVLLIYIPFVGLVLSTFAGLYTWFTAAHLVGVLFRKHHDAVERIYWIG